MMVLLLTIQAVMCDFNDDICLYTCITLPAAASEIGRNLELSSSCQGGGAVRQGRR
jgi:hypothetical protein